MPFTPPTAPSSVVDRDRLLAVRDLAARKRLTAIVAPPGYGKTVLLSQWAASPINAGTELHRRTRVRWLAITPDHNDGIRLAGDLWAALAPATRAGAPAPPLHDGERGLVHALAHGVNRMERVPPTILVMDDLHLLSQALSLDVCGAVIENAPPWLHVVIGTREEPPVPLHRLRLEDALVELRQDELAFTPEEAAVVVRLVAGRDIGGASLEGLMALTEGWPFGVQLAASSLHRVGDDRVALHAFEGDTDVDHYFIGAVVSGRPELERRFLLTSSALDRMSGPLCDAVLGSQHSQAMLEELERRSMFITRLASGRDWFRYHPLFRGALRRQLRREDPELERRLLRQAANWHLDRHDLDAAMRYLAEAGGWDEMVESILGHSAAMLVQMRGAEVAAWIRLLPRDVRAARTDLILLDAVASVLAGSAGEVADTLAALDRREGLSPARRLLADLARSYAAVSAGSSAEAIGAADRVLAAVGGVDEKAFPEWLGVVGNPTDVTAAALVARGLSHMYEGNLADAKRDLAAVPPRAYVAWRLAAFGVLAQLEAARGRLTSAEELADHALALAHEVHITGPALVAARMALASVAGERDELDRAGSLLTEAEQALGVSRRRVLIRSIATERAHLALASGDTTTAVAILADQRAQDSPVMPPSVRARTAAVTARVLIMVGDLQGAQTVLDRVRDWETSDVIAARMRLLVERGDLTSSRALILRWPDEPEPRARLERGLWSAILDHLERDEAKALSGLAAVIAEAEVEGAVGLFRDTGPYALGPARALYREAPTAFLRGIVDRPATAARPKPLRDLVVPLTDREYVVLSLLPTRLSNVEIAERLGVSLNTVKTHLKHIYRKFDAVRRSDAISAAERLHLL
jgi:LuxR family maltose regulon positive regulatory protein